MCSAKKVICLMVEGSRISHKSWDQDANARSGNW